jgi:hypothetical protein
MALAFYLWEPTIKILPYYFRGYAWQLPPQYGHDNFESTVFGISCSFTEQATRTASISDQIEVVDSVARGLASAISFYGLQLARAAIPVIHLPQLLKHEVAQDLAILKEKVMGEQGCPEWLAREMRYILSRLNDVMVGPDLETNLHPLVGPEDASAWAELFEDMVVARPEDMKKVTLVLASQRTLVRLELSRANAIEELKEVKCWPPPPMFSRHRLRTMLANLIRNAVSAKAKAIEVRLGVGRTPAGYLALQVWDNAKKPYAPADPSTERHHFGLRIIDQIVRSMQKDKSASETRFCTPPKGAKGRRKVFRLVLPISTPTRRRPQ